MNQAQAEGYTGVGLRSEDVKMAENEFVRKYVKETLNEELTSCVGIHQSI